MDIKEFLKELRDSADIQYKIFTEGSCFRLYCILKVIFPQAKVYWSDRDGHAITEIDGKFYDIGGEVTKEYIDDMGYYIIPENKLEGYRIMKWLDVKTNLSVKPEKYKNGNN